MTLARSIDVTRDPALRLTPDDVAALLQEASRTFALAVPLLSGRPRLSVELAYLLFRCADTLEDAAGWSVDERRDALATFASMLDAKASCDPRSIDDWLARGVSQHPGYRRLLAALPRLLVEVGHLPPGARSAVRSHVRRTALGMRDMVEACAHGLTSIETLRRYCYIVAGIVGELLTTIFVQDAPSLAAVHAELVAEESRFGEGLQLVNILKDELEDQSEGRSFLPPEVSRDELLAMAADDLRGARRYIGALERGGAPSSFVAFTSFPCELAEETLHVLRARGPGGKVSRARVIAMFARYRALSDAPSGA